MAIWQLNFKLIPQNGNQYDDTRILSNQSITILSKALPINKSWCAEDILFGSLDSTCVEICFFDSLIDEISVRLDITNLSKKQIDSLINFAIVNNLQILYNEEKLAVSMDNICTMVKNSDAFCYLNNPKQFLTLLSQIDESCS